MSDQLAIDLQVTGAQQALSALQSVKAAYDTLLASVNQGGQASQQAASAQVAAAQQIAQAAQQAAQAVAQGAQQATTAYAQMGQAAQQAAAAVQQSGAAHVAAAQQITQAAQQMTQAGQSAGSAYLSLGAVLGNLPGPLGSIASGFAGLTVEIERSNIAALGVAGAMGGASAAIVGGLVDATHAAAEYQLEMARVQTQISDGNAHVAADMKQLSDAAMDLGARTAFTSTEIAKGMYELTGAGLSAQQALASIEPITQLAMVGQMKLADATANVISVQKQWGLQSSDISHIVDVEALAVQKSMLHYGELGEVYRNIAGRAHSMGVGLEETTAALMASRDAGLTATMAGTAVGTMLDRLAKNNGETRAAVAELGLQLYDTTGKFVGLIQRTGELPSFMEQVTEKTKGMTEQQINHAESMLTGARASGFLRNALAAEKDVEVDGQTVRLKGVQLLQYYTEQLQHANGALQAQADIIFGTWAMQSKMFNASLQESSIIIGRQFLPALEAITPSMTNLINAFIKAPDWVHTAAAAFLALEAGVLAAGAAAVVWSTAGAALMPILAGIGAAIIAIAPELAIATAAAAALSVAWANDFGGIQTTTRTAVDELRDNLGKLVQDFGDTVLNIRVNVLPAAGQAAGAAGQAAGAAGANASNVMEGDILGRVLLGAGQGISSIVSGGGALTDAALRSSYDQTIGAGAQGGRDIRLGQDILANMNQGALDARTAQVIAQSRSGTYVQWAAQDTLGDQLRQEFGGNDPMNSVLSPEYVQQRMNQLIENVKKYAPDLFSAGKELAGAIAMGFGDNAAAIVDSANKALADTKGNFRKAIDELLSAPVPNQDAAAYLIAEETQVKAVQQSLQGLTATRQAEILAIEHHDGVLAALNNLHDSGQISEQKYQDALQGITEGHQRASTAAEEHRKRIQDLISSTDAASTSEGVRLQRLDQLIDKEAKLLPSLEGQIIAYRNAGQEMDALALIAQRLGISTDTLIAAANGDAAAQEQVQIAHGKTATAKQEHAAAQQNLTALIAAGAETEVAALLRSQAMHADIQKAIQGTTAEYQAHILVMEQAKGAEAALDQLRADGQISETNYAKAIDGGALAHEHAKKAAQEHKAILQDLLSSTDAAKVAEGLYAEQLDKVTKQGLAGMNIEMKAQVQALINAGDQMGAAQQIADYYHVGILTVIDALRGQTKGQLDLNDAIKATQQAEEDLARGRERRGTYMQMSYGLSGKVGGTLQPIGQAAAAGLAQGLTDGASAAAAAAVQVGTTVTEAFTDLWGIASPSRLWASYGLSAVQGLEGGITSAAADLTSTVRDVFSGIGTEGGSAFSQALSQSAQDAGRGFAGYGTYAGSTGTFNGSRNQYEPTDAQVQTYINDPMHQHFGLTYGPSASDMAAYQRQVQQYRPGYGPPPVPPSPTQAVGYRPPTAEEARQVLLGSLNPVSPAYAYGNPNNNVNITPLAKEENAAFAEQLAQLAAEQGRYSANPWPVLRAEIAAANADALARAKALPPPPPSIGPSVEDLIAALNAQAGGPSLEERLAGYTPTNARGVMIDRNPSNLTRSISQSMDLAASRMGFANAATMQQYNAARNPDTIAYNLFQGNVSSMLSGLVGKLPVALQAQYQALAAQEGPNAALNALWSAGGGDSQTLSNKLNNIETLPYGNGASVLGTGATRQVVGGSFSTSAGGTGSGDLGPHYVTAGTGLATHQFDVTGITGTDPTVIALYEKAVSQNYASAAAQAQALAANVSYANLAWSNIRQGSQQIAGSIAAIPQAFSAIPLDLNAKGLSSITGAWTQAVIGGPSGPQAVMPGTAATQGQTGNPAELLRQAALNIGGWAQNLGVPLQDAAKQYAQLSQQAGDTEGALRAAQVAQDDATDEVRRLTGTVQWMQGYGQDAGDAMRALAAAQQNLTDTTNQLASIQSSAASAPLGYNPGPGNTGPSALGYNIDSGQTQTYAQWLAWYQQTYGTSKTGAGAAGAGGTSGAVSVTVPDGLSYNDYIRQQAPMLDAGGYVEQTGLAIVHRGETYSGVGGGAAPVVNLTVNYNPTIGADTPTEKAQVANKLTELVTTTLQRKGIVMVRR